MRTLIERLTESLQITNEVFGRYLLTGPDTYKAYTYKDYLKYLKNADKSTKFHVWNCLEDDDIPTSVSGFEVWDVYYKGGKWMSYHEDYGEVPVTEWTLADNDTVVEIHNEL